jgi:hypothetical protein
MTREKINRCSVLGIRDWDGAVRSRGGGGISTENKLLKMKLLLRYSATYRDGNG